jgi:hypothetical protein
MIPISEKSSGGALVDWVPEGHDRKYTEPAAMSIRIAATPSAWAFDFARLIGRWRNRNSSSGCLSGLGPLRAGQRANPPPVPSERRSLVGGTDSSNLLPSSGESRANRTFVKKSAAQLRTCFDAEAPILTNGQVSEDPTATADVPRESTELRTLVRSPPAKQFEPGKAYADQRLGTPGIGNHHRRSLRQLTGRSPDTDAVLLGQRDGTVGESADALEVALD